MLDGIDLHDAQGAVEWHRVADAGNRFAFVRAAYGDRADKMVAQNYAGAKAAGLATGLYHFYRATRTPEAQANLMVSIIQNLHAGPGDLPPVLDVEDNPNYDGDWDTKNNAAYIAGLQTWIAAVSAAVKGTPIIYTRASFWNLIGKPSGFANCPLWVAHYTNASSPNLPSGWADYALWQYSEAGHVDGVSGQCDVNRFNGGAADLEAMKVR